MITQLLFCLEFAAQRAQSATSMLGSLLKQMVGGMEKVSKISQVFPEQKEAIGGCGPQLVVCCRMFVVSTKGFFAASTTKADTVYI